MRAAAVCGGPAMKEAERAEVVVKDAMGNGIFVGFGDMVERRASVFLQTMLNKDNPRAPKEGPLAGAGKALAATGRSSGRSGQHKTRRGSSSSGGEGTTARDASAPSSGPEATTGGAPELPPHGDVEGVKGLVSYWDSLVSEWRKGGPHPGNRIPALGAAERVIRQKEVDLLWGPDGCGRQLGDTQLCNTLSARNTHQLAVRMIDAAPARWTVLLLAYTFDREDVADALVRAAKRGACVLVIVDRAYLVGGTMRDMGARVQYMAANGVVVRVYEGDSVREDYEAVGRPVGGFKGILHAKALYIEAENGLRCEFIIGSANWTTSTRANGEIGIHGVSHGEDVPLLRRRFVFPAMRSDPHEEALRAAHLRAAAAESTGSFRGRSAQR